MALFVDGPSPTIDDLTDQDSGLLDVAQTAGINLSTKLRLAKDEIATDLQLWLSKPRPTLGTFWAQSLRIEQVVVTQPLARWQTMHALAMVYRDAYFSQLADRFEAKWQAYAELARIAKEDFVASGMALVIDPIVQALPPVLGTISGPQGGGRFYASVSWLNAAGKEGAASAASSIEVTDGNLMTVTAVGWPTGAVGFRVYAGTSLQKMYLQNSVALPARASYTYVPGEVTEGLLPGSGQTPDFVRSLTRTWPRG